MKLTVMVKVEREGVNPEFLSIDELQGFSINDVSTASDLSIQLNAISSRIRSENFKLSGDIGADEWLIWVTTTAGDLARFVSQVNDITHDLNRARIFTEQEYDEFISHCPFPKFYIKVNLSQIEKIKRPLVLIDSLMNIQKTL